MMGAKIEEMLEQSMRAMNRRDSDLAEPHTSSRKASRLE